MRSGVAFEPFYESVGFGQPVFFFSSKGQSRHPLPGPRWTSQGHAEWAPTVWPGAPTGGLREVVLEPKVKEAVLSQGPIWAPQIAQSGAEI